MNIQEVIEIGKSTLSLEKGEMVEINREALRLLVDASRHDPSIRYVGSYEEIMKKEPHPSEMRWIQWFRNYSKTNVPLMNINNLRVARINKTLSNIELSKFFQ